MSKTNAEQLNDLIHPLPTTMVRAGELRGFNTTFVIPDAVSTEPKKEEYPAPKFLEEAAKQMAARAVLRDKTEGERSMANIVKTFNSLTGHNLSEAEGWEFMVILKMVRGRQGKFNPDDYVDGAAYFALLGENESTRDR